MRNDEQQRGKLDSAFLLQHGKRLLERFNNVSKGQGLLVFVAVADVTVQPFGKERLKKMKASAFMFFNCCQRAGETCTSKGHTQNDLAEGTLQAGCRPDRGPSPS